MRFFAITLAILAGSAWTTASAQYGTSTSGMTKGSAIQLTSRGGGGLLAGGSDSCSNPDVINGTGSVFFDNSTATTGTQGQSEANCNLPPGTTIVVNDVWFRWIPDFTGTAQVDTCGSFTDTKIAAYPGAGCPSNNSSLACSDDDCGYQSLIQFPVTSGQSYVIQVGTYPFASGGTGMLNFGPVPTPQCPVMHDGTSGDALGLVAGGDFCYMYYVDCVNNITTIEVAYGSPFNAPNIASGRPVKLAIWDDPNNDMDPSDAVLLTTFTVPGGVTNPDTDTINVYNAGDYPVTGGTFVGVVVTHQAGEFVGAIDTSTVGFGYNWVVGDDTPGGFNFNNLMNNDYVPQDVDGIVPGAFLLQVTDNVAPPPPGIQYCPGDGIAPHTPCPFSNDNDGSMGGCYWGNASFPGGGVLSATGTADHVADDLVLTADAIENNFGIFFGAAIQVNSGNGNPLNDGLRCAGGSLIRLTPPTPATGNTASVANVGSRDVNAAPGITRRYQYWFRTPGGPGGTAANLTNGYEISWL